jgi:hypothetical protein
MFLSAYGLLSGSTFAARMRGDFPVQTLVLVSSAVLSFAPLLLGRKYLGALLVTAFLVSGIGGYWWTTIPWDEFVKDSGFPTPERADDVWDHILVASPVLVAALYAAVSHPIALRADLKERGADMVEIQSAAITSLLASAVLFVVCVGLGVALWMLLASGIVLATAAPIPTGFPALVLAAAFIAVVWAFLAARVTWSRGRKMRALGSTKPMAERPGKPVDRETLWARLARRRAPI